MSVDVTLTEQEMTWAAIIGVARHAQSVAAGRKDRHGFDNSNSGLAIHVEGACGELAVAKWKNRFWGGTINSFKGADLGPHVQVKTRSRHDYDLIVRADDKDEHCFVLVTGVAPNFRIRGWIWGHQAKRPEWLKTYGDRPEAWFVPADKLRPITGKAA